MSIFVIDTETTGLFGSPRDRILEIGIAELSDAGIKPVYHEVIRYDDILDFDSQYEDSCGNTGCWVFRNTSLTMGDVANAKKNLDIVSREVRMLLKGKKVTSYNVPYDFGMFLNDDPWNLGDICCIPYDIMDLASDKVYELAHSNKIPNKIQQARILADEFKAPNGEQKWIRSQDSYSILCPEDPMNLGKQTHRALDDAIMEAWILKRLLEDEAKNSIESGEKTEYHGVDVIA